MSDNQTAAMLDKKLDEKTAHTMFVCGIVMVIAVLIHYTKRRGDDRCP